MSAPKPDLTALQRSHVERARVIATGDPGDILAGAGFDPGGPLGDEARLYACALGITRGTVRTLLEIIGEITGGAA